MQIKERKIIMLHLLNGKVPFENWYDKLDSLLQRAIDARITRLAVGNFGDHKSVGDGVFELRIPKGPGLRVYYGLKGTEIVVLIGGGDKGSQRKDIQKAKDGQMKSKDYKTGLLKRLRDPEYAAGYLTDVLEFESQETFLLAVKNVLDAKKANISKSAKKMGLSRQAIYNALSKKGNPRLSTLNQILKTAGLKISFDSDRKAA